MEIFIVRHGIAEDPDEALQAGRRDPERRLTQEGQQKTRRVAQALHKRVSGISHILHSPYARARETAEIFASQYPEATLMATDVLIPSHKVKETPALLQALVQAEKVMVVGHEPHLSTLASYLITGREAPVLELRKAGIARIDWDGSHGRLLLLLAPKYLL